MNTNIVEGSYVMIKKFMEEGGDVFNNKHYNKVLCDYHNYLVSNFLKETTILQRLVSAYWFLKYAENNKLVLKKMSKDDIYKYISSFSEMNWDISYIDRNKFNFRKFLNWAYENKYTNLSGNMIIPNMKWHNRTSIKSFYSKEELIKLFNAIDIKTNKGKEDYLIICLICFDINSIE